MGRNKENLTEMMVVMAQKKGMSREIVDSFMTTVSSNGGDPVFPVSIETLYYWSQIWLKEFSVRITRGEIKIKDIKAVYQQENKKDTPNSGKDPYLRKD